MKYPSINPNYVKKIKEVTEKETNTYGDLEKKKVGLLKVSVRLLV
jgi:hypothetical protein